MTEDWWDQANCRDTDPRIFDAPIPKRSRFRTQDPWFRARAVCRDCPVILQCLEYTLSEDVHVIHSGGSVPFAAGCTPEEIEELRKRRVS